MIQQRSHIIPRPARVLHAALFIAVTIHTAPSEASAQSDEMPPLESLQFTPATTPAPIEPTPIRDPGSQSMLNFDSEPIIEKNQLPTNEHKSPLEVLTELMLIRAQAAEDPAPDTAAPETINTFSLRFEDASSDSRLWDRPDDIAGFDRWEVLPALYLRSGRVHDTGYESLDYADLYAELGVDLTSNTGLWLRYERLRQALGNSREGEQRDADALYLQFELRF